MSPIFDDLGYCSDQKEGVDFYINRQGFRVMTEKYLKERGWCCGNGCLHCPYDPRATKGNTQLRNFRNSF
ncbi:MAG TPA: DUF5522 domain-containing protein [Prolixibacteraceae bacterium]|nr:DUF5522 domain-containing protein [Prolixibacteraceae bacterium]